jgi:23S rRNA (uracil1939-C5)-methyltransferase
LNILAAVATRLAEGNIIELTLMDLAATGKSVGRHNGMVVMCDGGLPGETIECRITHVKRRFAFARMLRLLTPCDRRREPRCKHFGHCGGCNWQVLPYEDQLHYKQRFVGEALARIAKLSDVRLDSTVAADKEYFYRNKMEYSFTVGDQGPVGGLHQKGRYDAVFELEECFLQSNHSVAALKLVRDTARALEIPFYDQARGGGELRFLVVREGKFTDDLMLNVVTFNRTFAGRDRLFAAIVDGLPRLTSLFHTVNGKKANVAVGDELFHIHGEEHLRERLDNLTFQLTPFAFFQTNSRQTRVLYDVICEHLQPAPDDSLLDLFSGCGAISLYLADRVKSVLGIELSREATNLARLNAENNSLANAEFVAGDARKLLVELVKDAGRFDKVITDPPRAGLEQKAALRLARLCVPTIVAVSCNPATLARDLGILVETGYRVERVTPVDMFPQTAHVEAVATLVRD